MSYTSSAAQAGRGTTISIGSPSTLIGEVSDLPLDLPKWDVVDTTNLQSGSDSEFIPVIRKSSAFTIKGNRVSSDAGQSAVETAYQNATLSAFTVTMPKTAEQSTGDTYAFNAYVLGQSFSISPTKQVEFSMDIQVSGAVTFTAGTAISG